MAAIKETVLYYNPNADEKARAVKGVLVRMGIRIKNISPEQVGKRVGYLAGIKGFEEADEEATESPLTIGEEILVMKGFTNSRIDELLMNFRKAAIPKINLKAVVTETNSQWPFYKLYKEIKEEHESLSKSE